MSDLFCDVCGRPLAWESVDRVWVCGLCCAEQENCDCDAEDEEDA